MDNKTKILIGLGIVGVGGYLYWKSTQKKANVSGTKIIPNCNVQCTGSSNFQVCLDTCQTVGATTFIQHGQALTKKNLTSSNCQCNKK